MTKYECIKNMSVDEMAKMLSDEIPHGDCYGCNMECCTYIDDKFNNSCTNAFYRWLTQEVIVEEMKKGELKNEKT